MSLRWNRSPLMAAYRETADNPVDDAAGLCKQAAAIDGDHNAENLRRFVIGSLSWSNFTISCVTPGGRVLPFLTTAASPRCTSPFVNNFSELLGCLAPSPFPALLAKAPAGFSGFGCDLRG